MFIGHQCFLSLLNRLPELSLDDIGVEPGMKWIEKAAPIIVQSILECESSDKIAEKFGLKTYYDKLIADEEKQISVLNWILNANKIAKETDNYLGKGIVSPDFSVASPKFIFRLTEA